MKNYIFLLACTCLISLGAIHSQTIIFSDDFESGLSNWETEGTWDTTGSNYFSGQFSVTDSPFGDYASNQNESLTLKSNLDLSQAQSAFLSFQAQYDIEENFDFCFLEGTWDNGASWIPLTKITGQSGFADWTESNIPLPGFSGESAVKFRFRINSDPGGEYDGIYIDNLEVLSLPYDSTGPLIIYETPKFYEGTEDKFIVEALIKDASGLQQVTISYQDENETLIIGDFENVAGNLWRYEIPPQAPGFQVNFNIFAIDNSPAKNSASSGQHSYIAGEHLIFDDCSINSISSYGSTGVGGTACAVRFKLENRRAAFGLIRNYTDPYRPNNDIEVHVWKGFNGVPGEDLIDPIIISPEATLDDFTAMTRIDLRDSQDLWNLEGDVFLGYTVPEGEAWIPLTAYGAGNRSYFQNAAGWFSSNDDFHFRLVTGPELATSVNEHLYVEQIEIFPNPSSDILYAHFENKNHQIKQVTVSNAMGKICHKAIVKGKDVELKVSINTWPPGIYFISFSDQFQTVSKMFVKN